MNRRITFFFVASIGALIVSGLVHGVPPVGANPKTAAEARTIVVAAVGDAACAPETRKTSDECHDQEVANLISADKSIRAMLLLGDLQYESGLRDDYAVSFGRSFGVLRAQSVPVPGNHEYGEGSANGYFSYFGNAAHSESDGYYAVKGGSWHIIALNSNCEYVSCTADSAQVAWLKADLAANTKPCIAAIWHHPRFSSSNHGNDDRSQAFWDALLTARADIVLTGHDHMYERFAPQDARAKPSPTGLRAFVVGTGGRSLYRVENIRANSAKRIVGFGFLRLELRAGSYGWKFIPDGTTTTDTDSGSANCLKKPQN